MRLEGWKCDWCGMATGEGYSNINWLEVRWLATVRVEQRTYDDLHFCRQDHLVRYFLKEKVTS